MPADVEKALMKVAGKYAQAGKLKGTGKKATPAKKSKAKKAFVYATMTNMQKAGKIAPWRKLAGGQPSA